VSDLDTRFHETWLGMVQPVEGLVVSVPVLVDAQCMQRQPPALQQLFHELAPVIHRTREGQEQRAVRDLGHFLAELLQLTPDLFDTGPAVPDDLSLYAAEGRQTVRPTLALRRIAAEPEGSAPAADETPASRAGRGYVMLVWKLPEGLPFDRPETTTGPWEYPPAAKFDRLLRACRVPIGLLSNGEALRLVYAPHGESTGAITFRVDDMASVGGRPILDAFVMLLSASRFFGVAAEHQLPRILEDSRKRQANVTNALAGQVFEALGILLAGFEAAAERDGRDLLDQALARGSDHLYGGLLTVLLRLVFLLYADDRGLMPMEQEQYAQHMSVLGLFDHLQSDHGNHPDSMARRFGAWPRLVALFRAVFLGARHGELHLPARRGRLFDPEVYPFLEGWAPAGGAPINDAEARAAVRVPTVPDETVFRVLEKLLLLEGQRLSYRALDVEQIGSVYEALMGYHVMRAPGAAVCVRPERVWVSAGEVLAQPGGRRAAWLADEAGLAKSALGKMGAELAAAKGEEEVLVLLETQKVKGTPRARAEQFLLQPGAERRRTSSHYTPRSLSAPIVQRTLEPLLLAMGAAPAAERLLELKVCDPAMGSGAFLVEACRFLADQVVAAWTREGVSAGAGEDPVLKARRLVAQRCLYGVDKNPFAVDLAKLSLWLVTLAKDEPFTFVDHALRYGDSLVGLDFDQIRAFHWKPEKQTEIFAGVVKEALDDAIGLRQKILELAREEGEEKTREKERLLWDAEDALDRVKLIGDLVVGAFFAHEKDKDREAERKRRLEMVHRWLGEHKDETVPENLREMQREVRHRIPVFHWMVEFPEVFYAGRPDPLDGDRVNRAAYMDAFVGNPPFAGKNAISDTNGRTYVEWLLIIHPGSHGNADLVAHFFRRADALLGHHGTIGLIATDTIAEGDTRTTGLGWLVRNGASIYDARRGLLWGGDANVAVAVVHLGKGAPARAIPARRLNGGIVGAVNSRLRTGRERADALPLAVEAEVRFCGCKIYGEGFVLTSQERGALLAKNSRNAERIFPLINGEEFNVSPEQGFTRYVINLGQYALEEAERWPDLMAIVREKVKPERDTAKDNADGAHRKKYWWQFAQPRPELFRAIRKHERCLVNPEVSKHLVFAFQPTDRVFSHTLHVYELFTWSSLAVLQSRAHEAWARLLSSSYGSSTTSGRVLRYSASECFETFPFPTTDPRSPVSSLETIGERLYTARAQYMLDNQVGLTVTYNRLKDPTCADPRIIELRRLHEELDRAVLAAYGWSDIVVPPYGTPTTAEEKRAVEAFEDEVIDRLFALNAQRAEEERLAGATVGAKKKKGAGKGAKGKAAGGRKKKGAEAGGQMGLLGEDEEL
jgi:hypothetical protein